MPYLFYMAINWPLCNTKISIIQKTQPPTSVTPRRCTFADVLTNLDQNYPKMIKKLFYIFFFYQVYQVSSINFVFVKVGVALNVDTVYWGSWSGLNSTPSPALTLEWFFLGLSNLRMVISGSISGSSAHEKLTHLSRLWGLTPKSPKTCLDCAGKCFDIHIRWSDN